MATLLEPHGKRGTHGPRTHNANTLLHYREITAPKKPGSGCLGACHESTRAFEARLCMAAIRATRIGPLPSTSRTPPLSKDIRVETSRVENAFSNLFIPSASA